MPNKRILPADVYDTIEFMALVYGGIGAYGDFEGAELAAEGGDSLYPLCVWGMALDANGPERTNNWEPYDNNPVTRALRDAGIYRGENDDAVGEINRRLDRNPSTRVTFRRWTRELGVVRGEA